MDRNQFRGFIYIYITVFSLFLFVLGQLSYADSIPSRVYLSNSPSGGPYSIAVIDPATNTEVTAILVTAEPGELAASPDGSKVYAMVGSDLKVIDVLSNTITSTISGAGGFLNFNHVVVSPDGSKVYVVSRVLSPATLQIKVFNTATNALASTITSPLFNGCYGPLGLGIHPNGSKLYTACRPNDTSLLDRFFVIDTATNVTTVASTFSRDGTNAAYINAITVSQTGSEIYLGRTNSSGSTIQVFNGTTGTILASIPLPDNALPRAEAVTPDGTRLYVADERLGVHVINLVTRTYMSTLAQTTSRGFDIVMNPGISRIYTTLTTSVFVNNMATNTSVVAIHGSYSFARQMTITSGGTSVPTNHAPQANAGPDETVAVCNQTTALVAVDGSSSSDLDGDSLTYTWTGPFGTATGVSPAFTMPLGTNTVTLEVSDGQSTSSDAVVITVTQNTLYNFNGFLEPIHNDGSDKFKLGRVIPVKFTLADCSGAEVTTAVATLAVYKILDQASGTEEVVTVEAAGNSDQDNLFRYSEGNYIYNLDTSPYTEGTYRLEANLDDNTSHSVNVSMVERFSTDP